MRYKTLEWPFNQFQVLFKGPLKCYVMPWGWACQLSREKHYEGAMFNVISVTKGCVGVKFPGKSFT